jgi:hypothetical protein
MRKLGLFICAVGKYWWFWMATVALTLIGFIPAFTTKTIPPWVYWLGATLSMFFAFFFAWKDEYNRAESFRREADEVYADVILDWLQQSCPTPAVFPTDYLCKKLQYDRGKVESGLKILVTEFKVIKNNGPSGWAYNPVAAMILRPNLRKLTAEKRS